MELKNAHPPETVTEVWNLDIICTKKYTRTMTRRKAKELLRAFKRAPRSERRSSAFIRGARTKLEVLHMYNKNVLLKKERYPRTIWMFHLLCRYVALEFEGLGPNPDPSNCDAKFVASMLENMLSNYFDVDSKIRSKVFIVYIIVSAYHTYKIPKWYMDTLAGLVLKGTVIQKQLDDLYSGDDDLLYVGNIWSNDHLKYFLESDDFATDDEDSDISDQEESKSMHRKNRRKLEKMTKEEDDDDVILIKDEKDESDCDSTREFNSPVRDGSSKQGGGRSNNNQGGGAAQKSSPGNKYKSKLCGDVITIDDDDNVLNGGDVNSECVDSDVEVVYCDLRTGRAKNRTRRKPRTKFSCSVNSPDVKRSPKPICVDDDEDEIDNYSVSKTDVQKFDLVISKKPMELPGNRMTSELTKDSNLDFLKELESNETERGLHSAIVVTKGSFGIDDDDDFLKELQELASIGSPSSGAKESKGTLGSTSSIGVTNKTRFVETENLTSSVGMDHQTGPVSKKLLGLEGTISSQLEEVSSTQNIPMGENRISTQTVQEGQPVDLQIGQSNVDCIAHSREKIAPSEVNKTKVAKDTITVDSVNAIAITHKTCKVDISAVPSPTLEDDIKCTRHADFKESPNSDLITTQSKTEDVNTIQDKLYAHLIESIHSETETEYIANAEETSSNENDQSILKMVQVDESQKINDAKFGKQKIEIEDEKVSAMNISSTSESTPEKTTNEDHVQSQPEELRVTHESSIPEEAVSVQETFLPSLKAIIVQETELASTESLEKSETAEPSKYNRGSIFKDIQNLPIKAHLSNSINPSVHSRPLESLTNNIAHIESQTAGKIVTSSESWRKASRKHSKVSDDQDCNLPEEVSDGQDCNLPKEVSDDQNCNLPEGGSALKANDVERFPMAQTIQALKSQEDESPEDIAQECRRREDIENHENSEKDLITPEESILGSESNQTSKRIIIKPQTEDSDQSMECEDDKLKEINSQESTDQKTLAFSKIENCGGEDLHLGQNDQKDNLEPSLLEESQSIQNGECVDSINTEIENIESKPVDLEFHPLEETHAQSEDLINAGIASIESKPLEIVTANCKDGEIKSPDLESRALKESLSIPHAEYVSSINTKVENINSKPKEIIPEESRDGGDVINQECKAAEEKCTSKINYACRTPQSQLKIKAEDEVLCHIDDGETSKSEDEVRCHIDDGETPKSEDEVRCQIDDGETSKSEDEVRCQIDDGETPKSEDEVLCQIDDGETSKSEVENPLVLDGTKCNDNDVEEVTRIPENPSAVDDCLRSKDPLPFIVSMDETLKNINNLPPVLIAVVGSKSVSINSGIIQTDEFKVSALIDLSSVPSSSNDKRLMEGANKECKEVHEMNLKVPQPEKNLLVPDARPAIVEETGSVTTTVRAEETKLIENYEQKRLEEDIVSPHCIETTPLVEYGPAAQHKDILEEIQISLDGDTFEAASKLEHKFEEEEIVQISTKEDLNMITTSLPAKSDRLVTGIVEETGSVSTTLHVETKIIGNYEQRRLEEDIVSPHCIETTSLVKYTQHEDILEETQVSLVEAASMLQDEEIVQMSTKEDLNTATTSLPAESDRLHITVQDQIIVCKDVIPEVALEVLVEDETSKCAESVDTMHVEIEDVELKINEKSKTKKQTPTSGSSHQVKSALSEEYDHKKPENHLEDEASKPPLKSENENSTKNYEMSEEKCASNEVETENKKCLKMKIKGKVHPKLVIKEDKGISRNETETPDVTKCVDNDGKMITNGIISEAETLENLNAVKDGFSTFPKEENNLSDVDKSITPEESGINQTVNVSINHPPVAPSSSDNEELSESNTEIIDNDLRITALVKNKLLTNLEVEAIPTTLREEIEPSNGPQITTFVHKELLIQSEQKILQSDAVPAVLHEEITERTSSVPTISCEDQFEETSSVPTILHVDQFEETSSALTIPHEEISSIPTISREDQLEETGSVPTILHVDQFEETSSALTIPHEEISSIPTIPHEDQLEETGSVPTILHADQLEETGSVPTILHADQFEETGSVPTILHADQFEETSSVPTIPNEEISSVPIIPHEDQFEESSLVPTILHADQFEETSSVPTIPDEEISLIPTIPHENQFEETGSDPTILHADQFGETSSAPTIPHEDQCEETGSVPTTLHADQFEETSSAPTIPHEEISSVPTIPCEDQFEETSSAPTIPHEEISPVPIIPHEDQFDETSSVPTIPHEDQFEEGSSGPTISHEEISSVPTISHEDQFEETSLAPNISHEETSSAPTIPHQENSSVPTIPCEDQFEETSSAPTMPHEDDVPKPPKPVPLDSTRNVQKTKNIETGSCGRSLRSSRSKKNRNASSDIEKLPSTEADTEKRSVTGPEGSKQKLSKLEEIHRKASKKSSKSDLTPRVAVSRKRNESGTSSRSSRLRENKIEDEKARSRSPPKIKSNLDKKRSGKVSRYLQPQVILEDINKEISSVPTIAHEDQFEESSSVPTIPHEEISSVPTVPHEEISSVPTIPCEDQFEETSSAPITPHEEISSVPTIPCEDQFEETCSAPTTLHADQFEETSSAPTILHADQFEETSSVPTILHEEISSVPTIPCEDQFEETSSAPTTPYEETSSVPTIPHEEISSVPNILHDDQFEETSSAPIILHADQFEETSSVPTIPHEEISSVPTIPNEEISSVPTIPREDQFKETSSAPTTPHEEISSVATIPCEVQFEETSSVPTIPHEDQFEETSSVPTIPNEEISSVPTIPNEEINSVPTISHEDQFEETSSVPTILHADQFEETNSVPTIPHEEISSVLTIAHEQISSVPTIPNEEINSVPTIPHEEASSVPTIPHEDRFEEIISAPIMHADLIEETEIIEKFPRHEIPSSAGTFMHDNNGLVVVVPTPETEDIVEEASIVETSLDQDTLGGEAKSKEENKEASLNHDALGEEAMTTPLHKEENEEANIAETSLKQDAFAEEAVPAFLHKKENIVQISQPEDLNIKTNLLLVESDILVTEDVTITVQDTNGIIDYKEAIPEVTSDEEAIKLVKNKIDMVAYDASGFTSDDKAIKNEINTVTYDASGSKENIAKKVSIEDVFFTYDVKNENCDLGENGSHLSCDAQESARKLLECNMLVLSEAVEKKIIQESRSRFKLSSMKQEEAEAEPKMGNKKRKKNTVKAIVGRKPMTRSCSKSTKGGKKDIENLKPLQTSESESKKSAPTEKNTRGRKAKNIETDVVVQNKQLWKVKAGKLEETKTAKRKKLSGKLKEKNAVGKKKDFINKNLKVLNLNDDSSDSFEGKLIIPDEPLPMDCSLLPKRKSSEVHKKEAIPTKMMCEMDIQPEPVPSLAEAVNQSSVYQDVSKLLDAGKKQTNYHMDYILGNVKATHDKVHIRTKAQMKAFPEGNENAPDKIDIDSLPYSVNNLLKVKETAKNPGEISEKNAEPSSYNLKGKNANTDIPEDRLMSPKKRWEMLNKTEMDAQKQEAVDRQIAPKKRIFIEADIQQEGDEVDDAFNNPSNCKMYKAENVENSDKQTIAHESLAEDTNNVEEMQDTIRGQNNSLSITSKHFEEQKKNCKIKKFEIPALEECNRLPQVNFAPESKKVEDLANLSARENCDKRMNCEVRSDEDLTDPANNLYGSATFKTEDAGIKSALPPTTGRSKSNNSNRSSIAKESTSNLQTAECEESSNEKRAKTSERFVTATGSINKTIANRRKCKKIDKDVKKPKISKPTEKLSASKQINDESSDVSGTDKRSFRKSRSSKSDNQTPVVENDDSKPPKSVPLDSTREVQKAKNIEIASSGRSLRSSRSKRNRDASSDVEKLPSTEDDTEKKSVTGPEGCKQKSSKKSSPEFEEIHRKASKKSSKSDLTPRVVVLKKCNETGTSSRSSRLRENKIEDEKARSRSPPKIKSNLDKKRSGKVSTLQPQVILEDINLSHMKVNSEFEKPLKIKSVRSSKSTDDKVSESVKDEKRKSRSSRSSKAKDVILEKSCSSTNDKDKSSHSKDRDRSKTSRAAREQSASKDMEKKIKSKSAKEISDGTKVKDLDKDKAVMEDNFESTKDAGKKIKSKSSKEIFDSLKIKNVDEEKTVTADNFESTKDTEKKIKSKSVKETSDGSKIKDLDKGKPVAADNFESTKDVQKKIKSKSAKIEDLDKEITVTADNFESTKDTEKEIKSKSVKETSDGQKIKFTADNFESTKGTEKKIKSKSAKEISDGPKIKDLDKEKIVTAEHFELTKDAEKKIKSKLVKEISDGPKIKVTTDNFESTKDTEKKIKSKSVEEISDGSKIKDLDERKTVIPDNFELTKDLEKKIKSKSVKEISDGPKIKVTADSFESTKGTEKKIKSKSAKEISDGPKIKDLDKEKIVTAEHFELTKDTEKKIKPKSVKEKTVTADNFESTKDTEGKIQPKSAEDMSEAPKIKEKTVTAENFEQPPKVSNSKCKQDKKQNSSSARNKIAIETLHLNRGEMVPSTLNDDNIQKQKNEDGNKSACSKSIKKVAFVKEDVYRNEVKSSKIVDVENCKKVKKSEGKFAEEVQPHKVNVAGDNEQTGTKPEVKSLRGIKEERKEAKLKTAEEVQSRKRKRGDDNEDRKFKKTIKLADESKGENVEASSKMNVDVDKNATVNVEDNRSQSKEAKSEKLNRRNEDVKVIDKWVKNVDDDKNTSANAETRVVEDKEAKFEKLDGRIVDVKVIDKSVKNVDDENTTAKAEGNRSEGKETKSEKLNRRIEDDIQKSNRNERHQRKKSISSENCTPCKTDAEENSPRTPKENRAIERREEDSECLSSDAGQQKITEVKFTSENASATSQAVDNNSANVTSTKSNNTEIASADSKTHKNVVQENTDTSPEAERKEIDLIPTVEGSKNEITSVNKTRKTVTAATHKKVDLIPTVENGEDEITPVKKNRKIVIKINNAATHKNVVEENSLSNTNVSPEVERKEMDHSASDLIPTVEEGKDGISLVNETGRIVIKTNKSSGKESGVGVMETREMHSGKKQTLETNVKLESLPQQGIMLNNTVSQIADSRNDISCAKIACADIQKDVPVVNSFTDSIKCNSDTEIHKYSSEIKNNASVSYEIVDEVVANIIPAISTNSLEVIPEVAKSSVPEIEELIYTCDVLPAAIEDPRIPNLEKIPVEDLQGSNQMNVAMNQKCTEEVRAEEIFREHDINKSELELKRKPAKEENAEEILGEHYINKSKLELKSKPAKREVAEEIFGEHDINKSKLELKSEPAKREVSRKRSKSSTTNSYDSQELSDGKCKVVKLGKQEVEKYEYDTRPKPEAETGDLRKPESAEPKQPNVIVEPIPQFYNEVYRLDDPIGVIPLVTTPEKIEPVRLVDFLEGQVLIDDEQLSTSGSPNTSKPDTPPLDFDETPLSEKVKKKGSFSTKASSGTQTAVRDPCLSEQVYIALKPIVTGPLDNSPGDSDADHPFSEQDNPLGFFIENNLIQDECLIDPDTTENMFIPNTCKEEVIEHEEKVVHYFAREQQPTPQLSDDFINDNDKQIREEFSEELMSVEAMNKIMDKSLQAVESLQSQKISKSVGKERHPFVCTTLGFANMDGLNSNDATWSQESIMRTKEPFIPDTIKEMFLNNNTVPETAPAKMQKPPSKEKAAKKIIGKVNLVNIRKLKPESKDERNVYVRASSLSQVCTETSQKQDMHRSPIKDSQNMILDKVPVKPNAKWAHSDVPKSRGKVEMDINAFRQNGRKRVLPQLEMIEETSRKRIKSNIIDPEEVSNNFEQEIRKKPMDHRHFIATPEQDARYTRSPSLSRRHAPNNSKSALHPTDSDKYKYYPEPTNSRGHATNSVTPRRSKQPDNRYRQYEQDHTMNTRSQYNNSRFLNHPEPSVQIDNRHRHYSENPNNRVNSSNYYSSTGNRHLYAGSSAGRPHDRNRRDSYLNAHHSSRKEVSYPLSNFRVGNPRLQYQQQSWEDNNPT